MSWEADDFLTQLSEDLGTGICRFPEEQPDSGEARLLYTAAFRVAYASLWEEGEAEEPDVSVVRFKRRFSGTLERYLQIFPDLRDCFPEDLGEVANEVYRLMLVTGGAYHSPYRLRASVPEHSEEVCGVVFERGTLLRSGQHHSGLGTYTLEEPPFLPRRSVPEMFAMAERPLAEIWEHLLAEAGWNPLPASLQVEFLNHEASGSLWTQRPVPDGVSLLRVRDRMGMYYLYEAGSGSDRRVSPLAAVCTGDPFGRNGHRLAVNACLAGHGVLPPVQYAVCGNLVRLRFSRLPPPPEQDWIGLYSWPADMLKPDFAARRIMTAAVFEAVRSVLERQGYTFTRERIGSWE